MESKRKPYTKEEIAYLLEQRRKKVSMAKIAKKLQRTSAALYQVEKQFKSFSEKDTTVKISDPLMNIFRDIAPMGIKHAPDGQLTPSPTKDPYEKVQKSLEELIDSLIAVAKAQIEETHKKEIEEMKASYEKKLEHYQQLLIAAQDSNMVGFVKKRLGL